MIETTIATVNQSLQPVTHEQFTMGLDKLLSFAVAFNIPVANIEETSKLYGQALARLPGDLFLKAVAIGVKTWTWGNRLPMPGDLLRFVEKDWSERRSGKATLELALTRVSRDNDEREKRISWYRSWCQDYYTAHGRQPDVDGVKWPGPGVRYTRPVPADDQLQDAPKKVNSAHSQAIKNALNHLAEAGGKQGEKAVENDGESLPKKMANTVCHASAIGLLSLFWQIFQLIPHSFANELDGTAMVLPMAKHGIYRVEERRVDRTQSLNDHRVLNSYPVLKPPPYPPVVPQRGTPTATAPTVSKIAEGGAMPKASKQNPPKPDAKPTARTKSRADVPFSLEVMTEICRRFSEGESVSEICRAQGMPTEGAVRLWVREDRGGCATGYAQARELYFETMIGRIDLIAKGDKAAGSTGDVQRDRLIVDTLKWAVSKVLPKVYGDKVALDVSGNLNVGLSQLDDTQLNAVMMRRLAALNVPQELLTALTILALPKPSDAIDAEFTETKAS